MVVAAILTFLSGAVYEAGCVAWVHFSEKGQPYRTACMSMLVGMAQVLGIGESVHDVRLAPFFVLGYGAGTFAAVKYKSRQTTTGRS